MKLLTIFFALVFLPASQRPTQPPQVTATSTTLCEVSTRPDDYNGKLVTFKAEFRTDHIERSVLIDDSCPSDSMLPYVTDAAFGKRAFDDASNIQVPATLDERITAKFTGVFHFVRKPEMCMILNKEVCRRSLEIRRVDELHVVIQPNH